MNKFGGFCSVIVIVISFGFNKPSNLMAAKLLSVTSYKQWCIEWTTTTLFNLILSWLSSVMLLILLSSGWNSKRGLREIAKSASLCPTLIAVGGVGCGWVVKGGKTDREGTNNREWGWWWMVWWCPLCLVIINHFFICFSSTWCKVSTHINRNVDIICATSSLNG